MRHSRNNTPAYILWIHHRPGLKNKSKTAYQSAVATEARNHINTPIPSDDVEVEIAYAAFTRKGVRADVDNLVKPTLDALKGIAYTDDNQVRSISSNVFDRQKDNRVDGMVQQIDRLFYSGQDVVLIEIFSDTRLQELGGSSQLEKQRFQEWSEKNKELLEAKGPINVRLRTSR